MTEREIVARVKSIKEELAHLTSERVFLVAATKTQSVENINAAIEGGVDAIAENRVQEFQQKEVLPCPKHFIGHLQTNKVKYLIGNIALLHSCDRIELLKEVSKLSLQKGITSDVLMQINIGKESTKGGFFIEDVEKAYQSFQAEKGVRLRGFMAMLPPTDDEMLLRRLARDMRKVFENFQKEDDNISYLSMGMSGDYRLCVEEGSNMVRLGSTIFGERK